VDGPLDGGRARHLEGEAALARSTRPGDRHEPDIRTRDECFDHGEIVCPSDEAVMQGRQRRSGERLQGRERLLDSVSDQLKQGQRARDVP